MSNEIDKSKSNKDKIILQFMNKIMKNIGKPEINNITDFKNIDRIDIINGNNTKTLEDMENEMWKHFNKSKCGGYNYSDNRVLNILRGLLRENGMKLTFKKKDITDTDGPNKGYRRTHYFYSVEQ